MTFTVGLINPPAEARDNAVCVPLNLSVVSAALKSDGFNSVVIDLNMFAHLKPASFFSDIVEQSLKIISRYENKCDAFGISTYSSSYPLMIVLAEELKKRFMKPIIFGGPQATLTARRSMEICPSIDFIVLREGEQTIIELVRSLESNGDPSFVRGIYYRDNGSILQTADRPLMPDLDNSPFPDFDAIDIEGYLKLQSTQMTPFMPVDPGRGCPYRCTFCAASLMWSRKCRFKSPKRIVAEMDHLHNRYGIRNFTLVQDNLTISRSFVFDLCDELRKRDYTWGGYSRCDALDPELLDTMQLSGCNHFYFGIESASNRILRTIRKNVTRKTINQSTSLCLSRGIKLVHSYILGFPDEKPADINATLKSLFKSRILLRKAADTQWRVLMPMSGTEITHLNKERLVSPYAYKDLLLYLPRYSDHPTRILGKHRNTIKKLLLKNPDIFSADYLLKPKYFEVADILNIHYFYSFLLLHFYRTTHLIFTHTSLKPLALLDLYRKLDLPLNGRRITPTMMQNYFSALLRKCKKRVHSKRWFPFIEDVVHCETILFSLARVETNSVGTGSKSRARKRLPRTLSDYRLSCAPSSIRHVFRHDIHKLILSIEQGKVVRSTLREPAEYIFFPENEDDGVSFTRVDELLGTMLDIAKRGQSLKQYLSRVDHLTGNNETSRQHVFDLWQCGLIDIVRSHSPKTS